MEKATEINDWASSSIQAFWGEIAPCDHLVQIYQNDLTFLNTLEGFAGDGFIKGESVVIIASPNHIEQLNKRLAVHGFDIEKLKADDQYIPLDAQDSLDSFMVNDWPDEKLFNMMVANVMERATKDDRRIRAFGEMVAILWEQGKNGATVQLENLWHRLQNNKFCLYCAYPKSGFTQNAVESMRTICNTHSLVIDGNARPSTQIYYQR